jgi:hypothetical protein
MPITTHDIYMRYTDASGKTHVQEHRVWDSTRFVAARAADAKAENAKEKDEEKRRHYAEQITEEQYRKERA